MKRAVEYSIRKKTIKTIVIMVIVLIPISIAMVMAGMQFTRNREQAQMSLKLNTLAALVAHENEMRAAATTTFDRNLSAHMNAMTALLNALVTEDGYTGPDVFSDGFVVRLKGNEVVLPEGLPDGEMEITRRLIDRSLASGEMRTGRFVTDAAIPEKGFLPDEPDEGSADESATRTYYLSFARITRNLVYVDMTSEAEYDAVIARFISRNYSALESENGGFGGITLLLGEQNGNMKVLRAYGDLGNDVTLSGLGLSPEQIRQQVHVVSVNGKTYSCTYSTLEGKWDGWKDPMLVQMLPTAALGMKSVLLSLIIMYAIALIPLNMVVYVMAVQQYVRENVVTEEQAARFKPKKLRVRMFNAGVIGAAAIFLLAMITQGVGQLYIELAYGRDMLSVFSKQLAQVDQQQSDVLQKLQEDWYVYNGGKIASLLSAYPRLATPELLQACCDPLNIDYIMLFDDQGNETLCSRDYVGFTLDRGLGRNSSDFRRLLYGMPSIVHEATTDSITGLERQMIGVKLPASDDSGRHGALIMALLPEQTKLAADLFHIDDYLSVLAVKGTIYFSADAETGAIEHSSDIAMVGQTVFECGLSEKSLREGYMDFEVISGIRYFIVTSKYGGKTFFYALETGEMYRHVLLYAGMSAVLFALATVIIMFTAFKGYTEALFEKWAVVRMPGETKEAAHIRQEQAHLVSPDDAPPDDVPAGRKPGRIRAAVIRLAEAFHWKDRLPEEKVSLVFKASIVILLLSWANLLLTKNRVYNRFDSLANFLLQGDWMRGANLFSFCSILLVISYAFLINLASRGVLLMTSGFLLGKGQTFCRLLHSFVKYFSLFVVLYLMLHYLGFPIGTVVGSLSITTLALSLGAKDLAADILAGLSIVFERTFQVGDIVEINGNRGRIEEIGVRTTKLIVPYNNVLVISNHEIKDVLNLTRDISRYLLELKVLSSEQLEKLEAILNRALPRIQWKKEKIIGLEYLGVLDMGSQTGLPRTSTMTLGIAAYCLQSDLWEVRLFLNREIKLLCEQEGVEIK